MAQEYFHLIQGEKIGACESERTKIASFESLKMQCEKQARRRIINDVGAKEWRV